MTGSMDSTSTTPDDSWPSPPRRAASAASARRWTAHRARPLLHREVVDGQPPEDVVDQAGGDAEIGIVGDARRLEAHVGVLADIGGQRDPVLQPQAHRDREGVHDAGQGRPLLGHLHEHLAGTAVLVLADGHVPLAVGHPEGERRRLAPPGQPLTHGTDDHGLRRAGLLVGQGRLEAGDLLGQLAGVGLGLGPGRRQAASRAPGRSAPAFLVVERGWATLQLSR